MTEIEKQFELIKPNLEWLFGMASEVIPQGVQTINKPSQVPMIKNKRFVTDLDAKDDK